MDDAALTAAATTERLIVALDFDGTASPLVPDPMAARAHPDVKAQVERLLALPDTVVAYVSGRSMHDLRVIAEHDDASPIVLAGSHGAQYWYPGVGDVDHSGEAPAPGVREALWQKAREVVAPFAGVEVEPKTFGMGVHSRRADPAVEAAAFAAVDELVAREFPHWRRRSGHRVLEFSSRAEGKDTAVRVLREKFAPTSILFAGDDVTDEDAMRVLQPADLGVRVGPGESAATLRVENPQEMAQLLAQVANERAAGRE